MSLPKGGPENLWLMTRNT